MSEWRTITLRPVQYEVSEMWKQAVRLVSVDMGVDGTPHPSPTAIAEKIALIVKQHYEDSPRLTEAQRLQAEEGLMRCWHPSLPEDDRAGVSFTIPDTGRLLLVCGSFARLESHHSIPRHKGEAGHASERIWLCHTHHTHITQAIGGRDWRWLRAALGYEEA